MSEGEWWYDLKTHSAIQESKSTTKAVDRLGPYATREEAERALQKVEERNEAWENDPRWNDD
jgi:hypothetical protein